MCRSFTKEAQTRTVRHAQRFQSSANPARSTHEDLQERARDQDRRIEQLLAEWDQTRQSSKLQQLMNIDGEYFLLIAHKVVFKRSFRLETYRLPCRRRIP